MATESELLDIKQAAALLNVSEASLRRWTNSGRLASSRVGGRRERRFRRDDLLAFLEAPPARGSAPAAAHGARTRAPGHICGVYTSDKARTRHATRFLVDGLRESSHCFLAAAPDVTRRIIAEIARDVPAVRAEIKKERLILLEYKSVVSAQLAMIAMEFEKALQRGAHTVRMVGDVSGGKLAKQRTLDELLAYEAELDRFSRRHANVAILCLYDARSLTGVELVRTFQAHGDTFSIAVEQLVG